MEAVFQKIGPAKAKEILNGNIRNFRPVDHHRVKQLVRELEDGKFWVNGETIKIATTGLLIDGQHRLLAVVESGIAAEILVVRGLSEDCRGIDRGKPRTLGQWLKFHGTANGNNKATIARLIIASQKGHWAKVHIQREYVTDNDVIDFVLKNDTRLQECLTMTACCRRVIPQSVLAALVYIAAAEDLRQDTTVAWFIERLSRGDQLSDTDAVFHLRNRLMNQTTLKPLAPFTKKMMLTTAWNRTVLGEPTKKSQMWLRSTGPNKSKMPEKILLSEDAQFEVETQSASLV